jgi:hypothetical protein
MAELNSILPKTPANEMYICTNQPLGYSLELYVRATCTIRESLSIFSYQLFGIFLIWIVTKNITEEICNRPLRNRTKTVLITAIIGISLALLAVMLRLLSRMKSGRPGMDDWTIIVAMVWILMTKSYADNSSYNIGIRDPPVCDGHCSYVKY